MEPNIHIIAFFQNETIAGNPRGLHVLPLTNGLCLGVIFIAVLVGNSTLPFDFTSFGPN
jgi:hypothetical protein